MSKEKVIRKIVLNDKGFKGLLISGTQESIKENKVVVNEFNDKVKHPIHPTLEDKIADLRIHFLQITGLVTESTKPVERSSMIGSCDILAVEKGVDCFAIKAQSRLFDTKWLKFPTPKVDSSDGYDYFDDVIEIINEIIVETHAYMKGLKKMSDMDIATMYVRHGKDKEVSLDMFKGMTDEEKQAYCAKVIEDMGGFVILNESVSSEAPVQEEVLELTIEPLPEKVKA